MKKPITIGVIAVIAAILVTSAVDYSAIGAKPLDQIHLQTANSNADGIIHCPNNDTLVTDVVSFVFTEHIENDDRGRLDQISNVEGPQENFSVRLWSGFIQSNQFTFTGIGGADPDLADFCSTNFPDSSVVTVWGECGEDTIVQFESENGYSGSFTGNVLCV